MGVMEFNRKVYFSNPVIHGDEGHQSSSDESDLQGWEVIDSTETPPQPQRQEVRPRAPRPPPSPASTRKTPRFGHKLTLKKGRRSRHRYENERLLAAELELPEEALEGWDIAAPSRSHFTALLDSDNVSLLQEFLDDEMTPESCDEDEPSPPRDVDPSDPESAFLCISTALRGALKKHYHAGALEELERVIMTFFSQNPSSEFIADNLSGYERLLAHATSMYHCLHSRSFDVDGVRKLKIDNPARGTFNPMDPSLAKYLKIRSSKNKNNGRGI